MYLIMDMHCSPYLNAPLYTILPLHICIQIKMSLDANGKLFDLCLILFDKILTFLSPFCYQQKNNSVRENRAKVIDINPTLKLN